MKKVLLLSNHFITLYAFRRELIERLVAEGYEVILSLPEDQDNNFFENLGCKIIVTPIDRRGINPIKDIKLILFYRKMILQLKPDVIFSYTIKPNIYGCMAHQNQYKQVCNITGTGATFLKKSIISTVCKILYRLSVKHAYKVFFQNTGDRDYFIKNHMIGDNYEMLPGSGCNLQEHPFIEMPDDDITRFIFVGRVMEVKGIDEYLLAAKKIKKMTDKVEFYIAGWNEEEKYKNLIENYNNKGIVKYIGFRKDINNWIAACHCTVLPSHGGEGIPNVLLESAATGRACIGSDINGTKDVISNGITGYLFQNMNADDLTEKMNLFIHLSKKEKEKMGKEGRKKVENIFDREFVVEKYIRILNGE